ncbi:MAG: T9SS type A sorting domain-containing protein [Pyrinomonadaceae bacterium]|nr:T9SS type A sorting domain-containing protein [Pyrinomonadaceae bacterium]
MAKVTTATTNFTFPVGNAGALGQIGITPNATTQTTYTARYFRQSPISNVSDQVTPPLRHISSLEYWTLDRPSGSGGRVTLHWTSYSEVAAMTGYWQELRVARFTGSSTSTTPLGINSWENQGPGAGIGTNAVVSPGASYNGGFVTSDLVTGFGPFTLSSTIPNNKLPVELVSLKAAPTPDGKVILNWITASEHKASHFLLQHSTDGKQFHTLAQVQAQGESRSARSYQFVHDKPAPFNYYRLRSVDQDASSRLSSIVTAQLQQGPLPAPLLYPNPGDGKQLFVKTAYPQSVTVSITSIVGIEVFRRSILPQQGLLSLRPNLPEGTYLVSLKEGNHTSHFKLIVKQ